MVATNSVQNSAFTKLAKKSVPADRDGQAVELAATAVWLCSDGASYVSGHMLVIDGGMTIGGLEL